MPTANRRGRQSEDLSGSQFPVLGPSGHSNPGGSPLDFNGRRFLFGVDDRDLPAELFDVEITGRAQGSLGDLLDCIPMRQSGRIPTPDWEAGLLGLGNSRFRQLDPAPNSQLAQWRINARPLRDEVTGPWIQQYLVVQEVYRQYNGPAAERWEEGD